MDSGNLVLSDGDDQLAKVQWESFKNPTDTFLPGMNMDEILSLTSWIRNGDPGNGRFSFNLSQVRENKYVISQKAVFNGRERIPGKLYSIDEMPQVIAYLLSNFNRSVIKATKLNPFLQNSTHRLSDYTSTDYNSTRLIMNYTGLLEYQIWDRCHWNLIWWVPEEKCLVYNACGNFGSCNINDRIACKCLPGFKPSNPENWDYGDFCGGCTRNPTSCGKSDTFLSLKMMKVSDPDPLFVEKNDTECRKYCLNNCQCQAYSSSKDLCWIWTVKPPILSEIQTLQDKSDQEKRCDGYQTLR
ncbi:hypothetical protein FH972_014488 [Carpinus fangiana]|uniref:non-specific serine/threonine protein kinase n=1 Tax=Carpinus fangiana TaxID=176857 RepID=A0A5N6RDC8_9ROSI|nr:hypothetical protein FH972_014488 [Carpinus fangiana]